MCDIIALLHISCPKSTSTVHIQALPDHTHVIVLSVHTQPHVGSKSSDMYCMRQILRSSLVHVYTMTLSARAESHADILLRYIESQMSLKQPQCEFASEDETVETKRSQIRVKP